MAVNGYLSVEFDIMSPAEKFYQAYVRITNLPKWKGKVTIEHIPLEKKKTTYRIKGFQISEWYKTLDVDIDEDDDDDKWQNPNCYKKLEATMNVVHEEDSDCDRAIWTLKYEKTTRHVKDPNFIMETCIEALKDLDSNVFHSLSRII